MPSADDLLPILLSAVSVLFAGNLWWLVRMVRSIDTFKETVRGQLGEHSVALGVIEARHADEDRQANGRRRGDRHE